MRDCANMCHHVAELTNVNFLKNSQIIAAPSMSRFCGPRNAFTRRGKRASGKAPGMRWPPIVDAVEQDIAPGRTARRDPRHRALIRPIAVVEIHRVGVPRVAAIGAAPEIERLRGRPEA